VPYFAFEVEKITVWQQGAKADYFAAHHFADGVQIATAFGQVCDPGWVVAVPVRVQTNA
jgi:hypothetical protein